MAVNLITKNNFANLLAKIHNDYSIFMPVRKGETRLYKQYSSAGSEGTGTDLDTTAFTIGEVRAYEPLKAFFFKARQKVAENYEDEIPHSDEKPYCIVGVKACDLKGFKIQDIVFKSDDYIDPFYLKAREDNLIISADCTCAIDTCFCLSLHVNPYPEENFDLNLSEVRVGYIAEAGSGKGRSLIEDNSAFFQEASKELISERDEQRKRVKDEVEKNISEHQVPDQDLLKGVIKKNYNDPIWNEEAENCVECGACCTICPTCHCFLLYDQQDEERLARFRIWDSCLIKDFARVAGGANPRPQLWMRLRNRFEKKFDFFPETDDIYACTGCGRCILACPAKIDIRKVLRRNVENVQKQ